MISQTVAMLDGIVGNLGKVENFTKTKLCLVGKLISTSASCQQKWDTDSIPIYCVKPESCHQLSIILSKQTGQAVRLEVKAEPIV